MRKYRGRTNTSTDCYVTVALYRIGYPSIVARNSILAKIIGSVFYSLSKIYRISYSCFTVFGEISFPTLGNVTAFFSNRNEGFRVTNVRSKLNKEPFPFNEIFTKSYILRTLYVYDLLPNRTRQLDVEAELYLARTRLRNTETERFEELPRDKLFDDPTERNRDVPRHRVPLYAQFGITARAVSSKYANTRTN